MVSLKIAVKRGKILPIIFNLSGYAQTFVVNVWLFDYFPVD